MDHVILKQFFEHSLRLFSILLLWYLFGNMLYHTLYKCGNQLHIYGEMTIESWRKHQSLMPNSHIILHKNV